MLFLSPKLIALLFANICFIVSFVISLSHDVAVLDALLRAIGLAVVTYLVGYLFGFAMKEIFVETIEHWAHKETEAKKEALNEEKEVETQEGKINEAVEE